MWVVFRHILNNVNVQLILCFQNGRHLNLVIYIIHIFDGFFNVIYRPK